MAVYNLLKIFLTITNTGGTRKGCLGGDSFFDLSFC